MAWPLDELLGAADVSDEHLARIVADLLDVPRSSCSTSTSTEVAYDIPAITTASRHWVSGTAATPRGTEPLRMFVKHIQSWARHPFFQYVPAGVSGDGRGHRPLADRGRGLPLRPRRAPARGAVDAAGRCDVVDLDELSAAIWIEEVSAPAATWDLGRYRRAAYLLGRLAASAHVAPLAALRDVDWTARVLHARPASPST